MHEIKSKSFGQNQSQQQEQNCRTESMQSKMDRSNEEVVGKKVFNQKSSTETLTNDEMEDLNDAVNLIYLDSLIFFSHLPIGIKHSAIDSIAFDSDNFYNYLFDERSPQ